jgi:hypothetical protein
MSAAPTPFVDLPALAVHLRQELQNKRFILVYAYNGTGKTRLSTEFKKLGKEVNADGEVVRRDTLYFNAFTEDLFSWNNDLQNDLRRYLKINTESLFFAGLEEFEIETRIRNLLDRHADFDFRIDTTKWEVTFSRKVTGGTGDAAKIQTVEDIKVSRGEENLFIWCFFLAIAELAMNGEQAYQWVKYLYIDDPISSLDEQNAVAVATHLASMLKGDTNALKTVISTHHPLFFNVLHNELSRTKGNQCYFLARSAAPSPFSLVRTGDTPFFHHIASLMELHAAARSGQIFTHHFNMLRVIAEKTASFLGYDKFDDCIVREKEDVDGVIHKRYLNLLSHGGYSLYEPREMLEENKRYFRRMLSDFTERFVFNPERFPPIPQETPAQAANAPADTSASPVAVPADPGTSCGQPTP